MKKINILIFFLISFCVFGAEITLISLEGNEVTTGDIVTFSIQSEYDLEYLQKYKNKRVGDILYLLEVNKEGERIFARGILAEKAKEKKEKITAPAIDKFLVRNLNYKPIKSEKLKDFIIYKGPSVEIAKNFKRYGIWILATIAFLIMFFGLKTFYGKKKRKQEILMKRTVTLDMIISSESKIDFENIYNLRANVRRDLDFDTKDFEVFLEYIFSIQYKKSWSEDETHKSNELYSKVCKSMRVKDGI